MKAISYSLFGFDTKHDNCFDFHSYLRGVMVNARLNRLIYPEWITVLQIDEQSYLPFRLLFEGIISDKFEIKINPPAPLCRAMLWRLNPIFEQTYGDRWKYSHVICRDVDSPTTYREAQAVKYWINRNKAAHAITDSVSHTIPMMGGMVGFVPDYFTERVNARSAEELFAGCQINFGRKGSDQEFLNSVIYPKFSQHGNDSITQHYVLGMPNTFLSDYHTSIADMELEGVGVEHKESNSIAGHIGAAGWYETALFKYLRKHWNKFDDLVELERNYPKIFYWNE